MRNAAFRRQHRQPRAYRHACGFAAQRTARFFIWVNVGIPKWDPRGSPFQMPARLADGLGLESDLGYACARPFAPPKDPTLFSVDPRDLGPPRWLPGREANLG